MTLQVYPCLAATMCLSETSRPRASASYNAFARDGWINARVLLSVGGREQWHFCAGVSCPILRWNTEVFGSDGGWDFGVGTSVFRSVGEYCLVIAY